MAEPRPSVASRMPWPDAWERKRKGQVRWQRVNVALVLFIAAIAIDSFTDSPANVVLGTVGLLLTLLLSVALIVSFDAITASRRRGDSAAKLHRVRSSADQVVFVP